MVDVEQLAEQYYNQEDVYIGESKDSTRIKNAVKYGYQQGVKQVGWIDADIIKARMRDIPEHLWKSTYSDVYEQTVKWLENYKRSK